MSIQPKLGRFDLTMIVVGLVIGINRESGENQELSP